MSVVRHQILHEMLDTPPVARPPETDWLVIARELMEEIDRRGDALAQRAPLAAHPATTPEPMAELREWFDANCTGHHNCPLPHHALDDVDRHLSTLERDAARMRGAIARYVAVCETGHVSDPAAALARATESDEAYAALRAIVVGEPTTET
jgi:hypothetical protein